MDDVSRTERQTPSTSIIHISNGREKQVDRFWFDSTLSFVLFLRKFGRSVVFGCICVTLSSPIWHGAKVCSFCLSCRAGRHHRSTLILFLHFSSVMDITMARLCVCASGEIIIRRALDCLQAKTPSLVSSSSWIIVIISQQPRPSFSVTTNPAASTTFGPSACVRWPLDNGRHEERTHGLLNPPPEKELHSFF